MKKRVLLFLSIVAVAFAGCSDDENSDGATLQAAFVNPTANVVNASTPVEVKFSQAAAAAGTVVLNVEATNVVYGTDFTTDPTVVANTISVPFAAGATSATLTFTKWVDAIEGEVKNVKFTIASVSVNAEIPTATNSMQLNFNETAIVSSTAIAENGGNTVPNAVYIDLSSGATTEVLRTSWDLGFYGGSEFRVASNGAINKFAVKQLNTNNIDEVQSEDPAVTTGNYEASNMAYVDAPYGNISGTAIAEVSANDADNKVYLVNLGHDISTTPGTGTGVALTGNPRGWKKIRVLRSGDGYKLQYANLDATSHIEVIIPKSSVHTYTFFSLVSGNTVIVEPEKAKWDINLTCFTGETFYGTGESAGAYYFPDYAVTNTKNGVRAYQVMTADFSYEEFSLTNVNNANFETALAADQRAIGANWRATFPLQLRTDRFYILKDAGGNIYKLKFTAMLNTAGERGQITFEYKKLQ